MSKHFEVGDCVKIRFCLWDGWMEIMAINRTIFGNRYIAQVHWSDTGTQVITFRRWRIKAWL